jgi:hypothetical protein
MWKWDDSFLDEEYVSHDERRDRCASFIDKDNVDQFEWLGNPVVLYMDEDIILKPEEYVDEYGAYRNKKTGERIYLDTELKYTELKSIKGVRARLKDRKLVAALERDGGTCVTMPDSDHEMILLFWVGKTHGEVERIIFGEETRFRNEEALDQLNGAMLALLKNLDAKQLKSVVLSTMNEAIAKDKNEKAA